MVVPLNTKLFETSSYCYWFDEEGILCSITKKLQPPSLEETKKIIEGLKVVLRVEKVCIQIDATHSTTSSREIRNYAASEFPKFMKVLARVSGPALGRMLANFLFNINQQPYPVKMFNHEDEARKWLEQYL